VEALFEYDDGTGRALYVGGRFLSAGGVPIHGIAHWNGASWSTVDGGLTGGYEWVFAFTSMDTDTGPALIAGGSFTHAGGVPSNNLARWYSPPPPCAEWEGIPASSRFGLAVLCGLILLVGAMMLRRRRGLGPAPDLGIVEPG
jgi:hypothetical protein